MTAFFACAHGAHIRALSAARIPRIVPFLLGSLRPEYAQDSSTDGHRKSNAHRAATNITVLHNIPLAQ